MANEEKKTKKNKHFFKDFKAELKKVIWPTPKQLVNNTVAVVTIVLILAVIVFFLDVAFEALNTYGIDKIRSAVTTSVDDGKKDEATESEETKKDDSKKENNSTSDKKDDKKTNKTENNSKKTNKKNTTAK